MSLIIYLVTLVHCDNYALTLKGHPPTNTLLGISTPYGSIPMVGGVIMAEGGGGGGMMEEGGPAMAAVVRYGSDPAVEYSCIR